MSSHSVYPSDLQQLYQDDMLDLLSAQFPNQRAAFTEIINLQAILNLPKGTEHFISDPHGEYEAFCHILNNCSGVIREKVELVFGNRKTAAEQAELCSLIYYPREKLALLSGTSSSVCSPDWYRQALTDLIELARFLSSKYTRSKVRKAMPGEYAYILDELMHALPDEDDNRLVYHARILDSILDTGSADDFIESLCSLIKRLAVDHLHLIGDIYDRGPHPDRILDLLMQYHSIDLQWGNHDILWMGAYCGSDTCIATVLCNNIKYDNLEVLESGYGISLRSLALFAERTYQSASHADFHAVSDAHAGASGATRAEDSPLMKAISIIRFKLEGQLIRRHPEYDMADRLLLEQVRLLPDGQAVLGSGLPLITSDFPTLDPADPYRLTDEEAKIVADLHRSFRQSERLGRHVRFLYSHGSVYLKYNENLLFHGCVPLDEEGNFSQVPCGGHLLQGRALLDYADEMARRALHTGDGEALDYMYYLWGGLQSPLAGRRLHTFERTYLADTATWTEPRNPYYRYYHDARTARMILHEFGLFSDRSHIINGHTPVHVANGESPVRADGLVYIIDGGFCRAYQKVTGIAGYTLIFNSHGFRLKAHRPFVSPEAALTQNADILSDSSQIELEQTRVMVGDCDDGRRIRQRILELRALLGAYREGRLVEKN